MAYQTGSASDQTDLMNKLQTFAAANGFTIDNYDGTNRFLSISRPADSVYVSFYWDNVDHIAVYQALGYSGTYAQQPWLQQDDSGNGNSNLSQIYANRNVNEIGPGPYTAYHFFSYDDPYALHVVLEFSPGLYRHFGFGKLSKVGTWTGGAFCYGHHWNHQNSAAAVGDPDSSVHSMLLDGAYIGSSTTYSYSLYAGATLHAEGLPSEDAASKWGHCLNPSSNFLYNDRAGNPRIRIQGGARYGLAVSQFGYLVPDKAAGFIPIIPFEVFYHVGNSGSPPNTWYYLGRMANCGHIQLQGIDPGEELTIGSDTWIAFPGVRKSHVGAYNQETWNMGVIYRKDL